MTRLSSRTRRILELARDQDSPEPAAITRVEGALSRRIALGLLGGGAAAAKSATGAGLMLTVAKSMGALGVVATVAVLAYRAEVPGPAAPSGSGHATPGERRTAAGEGVTPRLAGRGTTGPVSRDDMASAASSPQPAQPARDSHQSSKEHDSAPAAASPRPRRMAPSEGELSDSAKRAAASAASEPANADRLALETRALREAQRALRGGQPERALALLDEQDGRYAGGALGQERAAARVMALCQSGQARQSRQLAERFERKFSGSPLLGRVRSACASGQRQLSRQK